MAVFAQRSEWVMKLRQYIRQAIPPRLRMTTMGIARGLERVRGQPTAQIHADAAPDVLASLRDDELLGLIAEGEQQALGALYDRYDHLVFSIALRITGEQRSAEAVTEDVFLAVWDRADAFRGRPDLVSGWIAEMARARSVDEMRERSDASNAPDTWREGAYGAMPWTDDDRDQQTDVPDDVRLALAALPTDQRQAVELAVCRCMTTSEIATALGAPEGVVKRHLGLGLGMLCDTLVRGVKTGQQTGVSDPTTEDQV